MEKIDILGLSLRGEQSERVKSVLNINNNKSPSSRKQELKNSSKKINVMGF